MSTTTESTSSYHTEEPLSSAAAQQAEPEGRGVDDSPVPETGGGMSDDGNDVQTWGTSPPKP